MVSKYRSLEELELVYACGHRDFGENRVQEMVQKAQELPQDIQWHLIGHLQRNKVKYIAPFVHMIHAVDSLKLLKEINKQAAKHERTIDFLFQIHIAEETEKFGLEPQELTSILASNELNSMSNVHCRGLMGMATLSDDKEKIRSEFSSLNQLYQEHNPGDWDTLSMGMSGDYSMAIEEGSTCVRIGSKVFAVTSN